MTETIALVGCGKLKVQGSRGHQAQHLYTGNLFVARRRHVTERSLHWYIVSAHYGLLTPDTQVYAYDKKLHPRETHEWSLKVIRKLKHALGDLSLYDYELHMGQPYLDALALQLCRYQVVCPTEGKGIGEQLQYYSNKKQMKLI